MLLFSHLDQSFRSVYFLHEAALPQPELGPTSQAYQLPMALPALQDIPVGALSPASAQNFPSGHSWHSVMLLSSF